MNPKPIQRRFYKTAAARDAAIERVRKENPAYISEAGWQDKYTDEQVAQRRARKPITGPILRRYVIEIWKPFDRLRTMFPGATDCEIVEAVRLNRDKIVIATLEKRRAGSRGASATQGKGEKHRDKIRAAFMKLRGEYPDAKKDWILYHLVKNAHPKSGNALLPKTRGYGERSIKKAVRDLK